MESCGKKTLIVNIFKEKTRVLHIISDTIGGARATSLRLLNTIYTNPSEIVVNVGENLGNSPPSVRFTGKLFITTSIELQQGNDIPIYPGFAIEWNNEEMLKYIKSTFDD